MSGTMRDLPRRPLVAILTAIVLTLAAPAPAQEGVRSGHMPGASCLPFGLVLTESGSLRSRDELELVFANAGAGPNARVITSCGSGVTAAILFLALATIGAENAAVYDGSWSEWGDEKNESELFPVVADL